MSVDLEDRIVELETRANRIIPATTGADGWANYVESRVAQESDFLRDVLAQAIAMFRDDILDVTKVLIAEALRQRVRGTFDAKASYDANDVVACDGASFIARRADPGPCPGSGWQMIAKQGQRGVAGPKGEPGKTIAGWVVDRANYTVCPKFNDGSSGPSLELRVLFEQFNEETT